MVRYVYQFFMKKEYRMLDWLQNIWHWKIEPIPLLFAFILYFGLSFLRQWKYFPYTPIYFSMYPLSRMKSDVVNKYVGSKYYPPFLEDEDEAEKFRKKAILVISISTILDTILIPACTALLWSLFLSSEQFTTALVILLIIQASRFIISMLTLQKHVYGTLQFRRWIAVAYVGALVLITLTMLETWRWVISSLAKGSYIQLLWNILDLLWSFIPVAIVSAVIGAVISSTLLDKKMRHHNLHEKTISTSTQEVITQHNTSTKPKKTNRN